MMPAAVYSFAETAAQARQLADCLGVPCVPVAIRSFPDGESLVRVEAVAPLAILYRSLDHPNAKLVELMLAASALRDGGAEKVMLVAPYLAYMRQDIAFHPGEAVSQQVIGRWIAAHFDALVTVDPHLHRIASLDEVMPGVATANVSAAPALVEALSAQVTPDTVLVGPDVESRPWVESMAAPLGLDVLVGTKQRHGDRKVEMTIAGIERVQGRPVILVDDVISSGETLRVCAGLLLQAGASSVEAVATHGLASPDDLARMTAGGIARIRTTETVPGETATIPIASTLAQAIRALS